jgi:hypothetical protein
MHASTHALGPNAAADSRLARVREPKTRNVGTATAIAGVSPSLDAHRAVDERAGPRSHSNWIPPSLARRVETALFAVTLAAFGYLYLGALPAQAL